MKQHASEALFAPRAFAAAAKDEHVRRAERIERYRADTGREASAAALEDCEAWADIAAWAAGEPRPFLSRWRDMEAAAAHFVAALTQSIAGASVDADLLARREAAQVIHHRLTQARAFHTLAPAPAAQILAA